MTEINTALQILITPARALSAAFPEVSLKASMTIFMVLNIFICKTLSTWIDRYQLNPKSTLLILMSGYFSSSVLIFLVAYTFA